MLPKSDPFPDLAILKEIKNICALDLGTTKFCIAHLIQPSDMGGKLDILTSSIPAEGMHRGMLADKEKAIKCLSKLIDNFEKNTLLDVHHAIVGVAGSHLKGHTVTASRPLVKKVVTLKDLHDLTKQVEVDHNSHKREILHIIPISYTVDSRKKLDNPLGLYGDQVGGEFFVIDAEKSYLRDIVDICNKSGLHVVKLFSEPLASSSVTLSDELKAVGCTVLDIGGGTSDGLIYVNGQPIHLYTVNIAGKMMTSDLSIGLGISMRDAENLKLHLASDLEYFPADFQDIFGKIKSITRSDALKILGPRIYELALLVGKEISPFKNYLKGGIVLTGGAANITGIIEIFTNFLGLPVTRIDPELKLFTEPNGLPNNQRPRYSGPMATTLGLIDLEINRLQLSFSNKKSLRHLGYFGTLINWLKELY